MILLDTNIFVFWIRNCGRNDFALAANIQVGSCSALEQVASEEVVQA